MLSLHVSKRWSQGSYAKHRVLPFALRNLLREQEDFVIIEREGESRSLGRRPFRGAIVEFRQGTGERG